MGESKVTVLYFSAPWCGPCRILGPVVNDWIIENTDIEITKIEVDENRELAQEHNVGSIPTLIFLKDGVEAKRLRGVQSKKALEATFNEVK